MLHVEEIAQENKTNEQKKLREAIVKMLFFIYYLDDTKRTFKKEGPHSASGVTAAQVA